MGTLLLRRTLVRKPPAAKPAADLAESRGHEHCVTEQVHTRPHMWNACVHLHLLPSAHSCRRRNALIILHLHSLLASHTTRARYVVNSSHKGTNK